MGKLILFLILGFMAYAVLKQLLSVLRFFEPKKQQPNQKSSLKTAGVDAGLQSDISPKECKDWPEEIKSCYDLFKSGALTEDEFKLVKAQLLATVGTRS